MIKTGDSPSGILPAPGQPIEERHLLQGMKTLAYIMSKPGGDVYSPLFERLEIELEEIRKRQKPLDRARRLLEGYTVAGGVNAIR